MKKIKGFSFIAISAIILSSCGNEVEEVKDPRTGQLTLRYEYYNDDSGQKIKDGESVQWYKNGTKRLVEHYKDGILEGESIFYKSADSIYYNNYQNGKFESTCLLKDSKGTILTSLNFKNDMLNGKQLYNDDKGKLQLNATFKDNIPIGKWQYYDDKGKKVGSFSFKNGICQELIGTWKIEDKKECYYIFHKDGTAEFKSPLYINSLTAATLYHGLVEIDNKIKIYNGAGRLMDELTVFNISKNKIMLLDFINHEILHLEKILN